MTTLSISMAATLLMISLAPAAQAYDADPADNALRNISQVGYDVHDTAEADGSCLFSVTPELASILGLPSNWRTGGDATGAAVACNNDN